MGAPLLVLRIVAGAFIGALTAPLFVLVICIAGALIGPVIMSDYGLFASMVIGTALGILIAAVAD